MGGSHSASTFCPDAFHLLFPWNLDGAQCWGLAVGTAPGCEPLAPVVAAELTWDPGGGHMEAKEGTLAPEQCFIQLENERLCHFY